MDHFVEFVPKYESENDSDASSVSAREDISKPQLKRSWVKKAEFESIELAEMHVNSFKTWKKTTKYNTSNGHKVTYRCTAGQYRKNECPASVFLLYHSESLKVSLYQTTNAHSNHSDGNRGLTSAAKRTIRQLFEEGITKPNAIINAFKNRNLEEPDKPKLKNFLASIRLEKFGSLTISAGEIVSWCSTRMEVPENEDQPFVLNINVAVNDMVNSSQYLKFVLSTKRLVKLADKSNGVQVDSTSKLTWQGYPVMIIGSSDTNQTFHPFGIAVCDGETEADFAFIFSSIKDTFFKITGNTWKPDLLLADENTAITKGFESVFGHPVRRLVCYSHVIKKIDTKLRGVPENSEIKNDIESLHLCQDDCTFDTVSELFLQKWNNTNIEGINDFIQYFQTVWLNENRFWYLGANIYFPSTNNSLEATNSLIKKEQIIRERLPVVQFLEGIENKIVKKWSNRRDPTNFNYEPFATKPQRSIKIWKEAYQWVKSDIKIIEEIKENRTIFHFSSTQTELAMTANSIQTHLELYGNWVSFDQYKEESCRMWMVTAETDSADPVTTCSCPVFLKKYICKHSLGVLIRLGKVKVPSEAKNVSTGPKRGRGRPSSKKARLIE